MDIQEMVESRIEELQAMSKRNMLSKHGRPQHREMRMRGTSKPAGRRADRRHAANTQEAPVSAQEIDILELSSYIDERISEVSMYVLDIAEQVAGDYSRLEKDILRSRLAILQSAEVVLDMALSLRRQVRSIVPSCEADINMEEEQGDDIDDIYGDYVPEPDIERRRRGDYTGRASMHENGVKDYFRKTEQEDF